MDYPNNCREWKSVGLTGLSIIDEQTEEETTKRRKNWSEKDILKQIKKAQHLLKNAFENDRMLLQAYKGRIEEFISELNDTCTATQHMEKEKQLDQRKCEILLREISELKAQRDNSGSQTPSSDNDKLTNETDQYSQPSDSASLIQKLQHQNNTLTLTVHRLNNKTALLQRQLNSVYLQIKLQI